MILSKIADEILINPVLSYDVNELYILSSYAVPSMLTWYFRRLKERVQKPISISLLLGMTAYDGISEAVHNEFLALSKTPLPTEVTALTIGYIYKKPAVNANLFIWAKNGHPIVAFSGSASFTQSSFLGIMHDEIMDACDPNQAKQYFDSLISRSIYPTLPEIDDAVLIQRRHPVYDREVKINSLSDAFKQAGYQVAKLSLVTKTGEPGAKSGLNWGQRPGREPNQAYIPLPAKVARSRFFPLGGQHFTAITDDGLQLVLRVEQENDKAITTPERNSDLGEYFRRRIGVANGARVTRADLDRYGRTDVVFIDMQDGTYYMDFSVF